MTPIQRDSQAFRFGRMIGAPLGIAALAATVGCGVRDSNSVSAQPLGAQPVATSAATPPAGSPVLVSCEPHQRTLVRPVVVNGAAMSQIECIASGTATAPQFASRASAGPVPHGAAETGRL